MVKAAGIVSAGIVPAGAVPAVGASTGGGTPPRTPLLKKAVSRLLQVASCPLYRVLRDLSTGVHGLVQTVTNQGNVLAPIKMGQDGLKQLQRKRRQRRS